MIQKKFYLFFVVFVILQASSGYSQTDTVKEKLKFDFGFTRSNNINIWPLFKKVSTPSYRETDILFPLYVKKSDESKSWKYLHLAPVIFNSRTPAFKDFRLFSLYYPSLFHYRKDSNDITSFRLLEIIPRFSLMDVRKSPRGLYLDQNFLFFIWFKKDLILQKSHFVVFPLSWYFKNKENHSYTFSPLFSKGRYEETRYLALTPLYWHFKSDKKVSNTLFPLFFQKKSLVPEIQKSSTVLFPFYYSYRDFVSSKRILFPILWDMNIFDYHSFTMIPFFSTGRSKDNTQRHNMITPFYWQYRNNNGSGRILFPVWWRNMQFFNMDTAITNIIFPFSWNYKSRDSHTYTFFPLYSSGNYKRNSYVAITPLFWHTENEKRSGNTLFPLIYQRKSKQPDTYGSMTLVAPFWWSYNFQSVDQKILFPVYWDFKSSDYHNVTIFPFFSSGHTNDHKANYFAVTPFYWNRNHERGHSRTLFPIFWNNIRYRMMDTLKTNVIFPLWWDFSSNRYHNSLLFPVYGRFSGPKYLSTTVMPFYSTGSSFDGTRKHYAISPLYWNFRNPKSKNSLFIPLFYHRTEYGQKDTVRILIFSFLWWTVNENTNHVRILFPLFWDFRTPDYKMSTLLPLYYYQKEPEKKELILRLTPLYHYTNRNKILTNTLLPVWWYRKSLDKEKALKEFVLFPVYWSLLHDDIKARLIFPIFWSITDSSYHSTTIFPLYSAGRSPDNEYSHLVLTPLYWNFRNINNRLTTVFPLFWHARSGTGLQAKTTDVLFPVYYAETSQENKFRLIFPVFWYNKSIDYKSFTVFPLLTAGKSADGRFSNLMLTPLVWSRKDENGSRFTFFPLFWYKKNAAFNYHSLIPIYFYSASPTSRNFQFLLLLYQYRKKVDELVYNGILWKTVYWNHYDDGGYEFRLLYLLIADVNKKGLIEKSYFPFYYYSKVDNTNEYKSWFFYFFSRSKIYLPEVSDYYIEERFFWFLRWRSNYNTLERDGKARYLKQKRG